MSNTYLGLDIGTNAMKLAVVKGGRVQKLCASLLPENLVRDGRVTSPDALAEELRGLLRAQRISERKCVLALSPEAAFLRRITVPWMTTEQLKVNLPYEFHDYIQKDKELYFYDYAVAGVNRNDAGNPETMDLLAAAAPKELIAAGRSALRRAGMKLSAAVPEYLTYRNLITAYERAHPDSHPQEYCLVDMGHSAIRVHMYRDGVYETSRVLEYGGVSVGALIADSVSVDFHIAADYMVSNYKNVQELSVCRELYRKIAVEILRAVNFYGFNTPDSDLRDIYFGGGLVKIQALMDAVRDAIPLNLHFMEELLPSTENTDLAGQCPAAIGAALEMAGR
ncbi:pilus assembly protein PilM [Oscillibacter sp.]|uniref:pilus assembly protein PilM n=1 Tax=Oscillibacter sp. TaxID=1945593 RepID=UPI00289677C7|nr:pilus assembly protein PilM [Oscillibacter sp.]